LLNTRYSEGSLFRFVEVEATTDEEYTIEATPTWNEEDAKYFTVRVVTDHEIKIEGTCGEDSCSNDMLHDAEEVEDSTDDETTEEEEDGEEDKELAAEIVDSIERNDPSNKYPQLFKDLSRFY